ncbi:MAG: LON peptidase substrate-binding domain-containing protein [Planctomycetes bacterium]|nr:LON peptidase substrate-binding domain-containing protein [Planctomycetota bacterium]
MSEENAIQVNFGKPMPVFPLDAPVLLPQQVLPLHIFEPRYRQMVEHSLDASGQIAMAMFAGSGWKTQYHGRPRLRPAVCVGQIVQHDRLPDGRYNILLQGVCRARIVKELPASEDRLYRMAMFEPIGLEQADNADLGKVRQEISQLLAAGPLSRMLAAEPVLEWVNNDDIPSPALLELVSFAMINDASLRYRLLAEADISTRAGLILGELHHLQRLIERADAQHPEQWPKGCSWN